MPIPPRDPELPGYPVDPTPIPTPVPTPTPVTPTPAPATGEGVIPTGEAPWVTQQRNMLLGIADRGNWPDWIRAAYGLPPRVEGAAAAPYIEQITNQQRRAQQIQAQGARMAAARAARAPVAGTPGAPIPIPGVPASNLPPFLASAVTPTPAEDGYASPQPYAANQYPMLTALSTGGDFIDEIRKGVGGGAAGGGGGVAGGGFPAPAAAVPSPVTISAPRRGLFS